MDVDPQETKRIASIGQVFNSVFDYSTPVDLKGNRVIDIFPQVDRQVTDIYRQDFNQDFDVAKQFSLQDQFTILFNGMVKTIRISAPTLTPPTVLNDASTISGNGTWAATTSASNLSVDNINSIDGGGALQFDLAALGSTGYLENSTFSPVDLSSMEGQGTLFLWVYLPTASVFTNVILRWGSSSSAYYTYTATTTQANTVFQTGWNLLAFPWASATTVGSPDSSAIDYLRVTWTYNGTAQTGVHLDTVSASMGTLLNIEYYSKYLFRDVTTGAFQEQVSSDTNLINLDTETFDLLTYKVCNLAAQQQQGLDATFHDGPYFQQMYTSALQRYRNLYLSEIQPPQQSYYRVPQPNRLAIPKVRRGF